VAAMIYPLVAIVPFKIIQPSKVIHAYFRRFGPSRQK
jgi:hypothetical protein